jgi:hypothetical protein
MNRHLTEDEVTALVSGVCGEEQLRHHAGCAACRNRTAVLEEALSRFRQSARDWAVNERVPVMGPASAGRSRAAASFSGARWLFAACALALIAAVPAYNGYVHQRTAHQAERDAADAALLRQVDAEVSRAVPQPMEPLLPLVSWNSGAAPAAAETR